MHNAVLVYGYEVKMRQVVEAVTFRNSRSVDILRLSGSLTLNSVRLGLEFISTMPTHPKSSKRTVVIDMQSITRQAQTSVLKTLEEPVGTAQFVLFKSSIFGILDTIISRCQVIECKFPGYLQLLKDLTIQGMEATQAARIASFMRQGYFVNEVPSEQDFNNVSTLLKAGASNDLHLLLEVVKSFSFEAIVALRHTLVQLGKYNLVSLTYGSNTPQDTALIIGRKLMI